MGRAGLTGILLVGGGSTRFGAAKPLAVFDGATLAERAWNTLGEACDVRIAVGKATDAFELPFPTIDDGSEVRASIVGLAAGLRAAPTDLCVVLPVDCPLVTAPALEALADACRDAAMPQTGPLPGAYRTSVVSALERGELSIRRALAGYDVATVELDPELLANVNTPEELERLERELRRAREER